MGSHVIMQQRQHQKNYLLRGQVSCQAAATKMVVKFDMGRAGRNVQAEIDSYTPLMPASHRFELICIVLSYMYVFGVTLPTLWLEKTHRSRSCVQASKQSFPSSAPPPTASGPYQRTDVIRLLYTSGWRSAYAHHKKNGDSTPLAN